MMKKLIVIILCVCMLFNFAAQPVHAMGAEGIIIGGAAAAGVTLTVGQVALIAAAAFGLIYAATHADEIGAMLESALDAAVNNDETRQQQLTNWKTNAFGGLIAIATAPAWIKGVIKGWANDSYNVTNYHPLVCQELTANVSVPAVDFWNTSRKWAGPGAVVRAGSISTVQDGEFYSLVAVMTVLYTSRPTNLKTYTYKGQTYAVQHFTWATNPAVGNLNAANQAAYDAISQLPNYNDIKAKYGENISTEEAMMRAYIDGLFVPGDGSICPDVKVEGVEGAMNDYGIDNINIPDINVGQSDLLVPDNTASINDTLNDVLTRLEQQELTWQQYMDDVAVGTPSVSVPAEGTQTGTLEYPLTDTGVSDVPMDTTQPDNPSTSIPEGIEPYTLDLRTFFPFCIPFDIVKFVDTLCADPEAPCFTWGIATPDGGTQEMEVDLAVFDPVAEILRGMELLLFIIGLAFLTRALIRG